MGQMMLSCTDRAHTAICCFDPLGCDYFLDFDVHQTANNSIITVIQIVLSDLTAWS